MQISIIVPVFNDSENLRHCLTALMRDRSDDCEIIVVDDASTDNSAVVAGQMGARVLRLDRNSGPAAARNHGARHARGDILFFVDSDVVVAPKAVRRVGKAFETHRSMAAIFGSYDVVPPAEGLVSQYWNLRHCFVHQNGNSEASTFWAGCGAIRRSVFEAVGGFDAKRFPQSSVEDIELGYRLHGAGHRILLDKALQGTHLKRWTLPAVIRTDIFHRALPWARLILETRNAPDDLNLKSNQRLSCALAMLACLLLPVGVVRVEFFALALCTLLGVVVVNRELYAFFFRQRGFVFANAGISLHILYYLCGGVSFLIVWIGFRLRAMARWSANLVRH